MGVSFNIKTKTGSGFKVTKVPKSEDDPKKISKLITSSIESEVVKVVGTAIVETVKQHNQRVLIQAAIFFQRVVTRTPKDEYYKDPDTGSTHRPDDDYVWKHWKVLYWGKSVTAEQMGEHLFDTEAKFNDKRCINAVAKCIKDSLFGGEEKFNNRKTRIRSLRFENTHPRFSMLEYGEFVTSSSMPKRGDEHWHGLQNFHSVQAPYGMLRVTQAEMEEMNIKDFDKWVRSYKKNTSDVTRVRSKSDMKKIKAILDKKMKFGKFVLTDYDIDAITSIWEGNGFRRQQ